MSETAIFYPVMAQVFLTFALATVMFRRRVAAFRSREADLAKALFPDTAFPPRATLAANAYQNQFEMPLLFYTAAAFAVVFNAVDVVLVGLAWAYVVFRALHAVRHVGGADTRKRFRPFAVSFFILVAMWISLALHVLVR